MGRFQCDPLTSDCNTYLRWKWSLKIDVECVFKRIRTDNSTRLCCLLWTNLLHNHSIDEFEWYHQWGLVEIEMIHCMSYRQRLKSASNGSYLHECCQKNSEFQGARVRCRSECINGIQYGLCRNWVSGRGRSRRVYIYSISSIRMRPWSRTKANLYQLV